MGGTARLCIGPEHGDGALVREIRGGVKHEPHLKLMALVKNAPKIIPRRTDQWGIKAATSPNDSDPSGRPHHRQPPRREIMHSIGPTKLVRKLDPVT